MSNDESLLEIIVIMAIRTLTGVILTSVSAEKEHHFNETKLKAYLKLV